jgi:hypothetical protein
VWWGTTVIPATWEVEVGSGVPGQAKAKYPETLSQKQKGSWALVVHACNSSYLRG